LAAHRHRGERGAQGSFIPSRYIGRAGVRCRRHGRWSGNHFRGRSGSAWRLGRRGRSRRTELQGSVMEILTGNELMSGATVYLDRDGKWVEELQQARVFLKEEAEARDAALAATRKT